jgi:hypothetical protein
MYLVLRESRSIAIDSLCYGKTGNSNSTIALGDQSGDQSNVDHNAMPFPPFDLSRLHFSSRDNFAVRSGRQQYHRADVCANLNVTLVPNFGTESWYVGLADEKSKRSEVRLVRNLRSSAV